MPENGTIMEAADPTRRTRMTELGVSGLRHQGGILYEEQLRELTGQRWRDAVWSMTSNDATIGAILFAIELLIRQVTWTVDPLSDAPEDTDAAAFIDEALHDMEDTWEDTLSEILSMIAWGWSYHELVYKQRADGKIGWSAWAIRSQDTLEHWDLTPNGRVLAMVQRAPPAYDLRTIPIEKALHFRPSVRKGSPEGVSVLRRAYRAWNAKHRIENLEGIGVERDLAGLPVTRIPAQYMVNEADPIYGAYKDLASNIRRDEQEGVVLPSDRDEKGNYLYDLTLLTTGGTRQFNTNDIIARYKIDMAMCVLADFLMIGHGDTGSWSLVSSRTSLFAQALGGWSQAIAAVPNRRAIPQLLALNGMRGRCELRPGDIETPDLGPLGDFLQKAAAAGMPLFPDPALEGRLRGYAGLPPRSEDADAAQALQTELEALRQEVETLRKTAPAADPSQPPTVVPATTVRDRTQARRFAAADIPDDLASMREEDLAAWLDDLTAFFADQAERVADRLTVESDTADVLVPDDETDLLLAALEPHQRDILSRVLGVVTSQLEVDFTLDDPATRAYLTRAGSQIVGITATTRAAVQAALVEGQAAGEGVSQLAARLRGLPAFNQARARTVARTELGASQLEAAYTSYVASGVVQGIRMHDGDHDAACAARDGQVLSLDEARTATRLMHPNCTVAWAPVTDLAGARSGA